MLARMEHARAKITKSLRQNQPTIGGALIVIGGTYFVINALLWGWWNTGTIDDITSPTFQQQVSLALGFLAWPLFTLSFSLAAIGVTLIIIQEQTALRGPSSSIRETLKAHKRIAIGILLAAFGLIYQVIGPWILWNKEYPWTWQTEIAKYGSILVWSLFILSLIALMAGLTLLYKDSKLRQEKHL